jgi:hypothetical protein
VGRKEVPLKGGSDEVAVRVHQAFYVLAGSDLANWILRLSDSFEDRHAKRLFSALVISAVDRFFSRSSKPDDIKGFIEGLADKRIYQQIRSTEGAGLDIDEMVGVFESTPLRTFDTWAWRRNSALY